MCFIIQLKWSSYKTKHAELYLSDEMIDKWSYFNDQNGGGGGGFDQSIGMGDEGGTRGGGGGRGIMTRIKGDS